MERNGHHAIGQEESLLHTVAMMAVDIDIKDPNINSKQLEYADYNIVHVAEPTCFPFFGMMQPSCPVDSNVGLSGQYSMGTVYARSSRELTKGEQASKCWVIWRIPDLELVRGFALLLTPLLNQSVLSKEIVGHCAVLVSVDIFLNEILFLLTHILREVMDVFRIVKLLNFAELGFPH